MGKKRRRQQRAERLKDRRATERRQAYLAIAGFGDSVPLEDRPEYKAQMLAWRRHGCPQSPDAGPLAGRM